MSNEIRLLIADDHTLFRQGLARLLGAYDDLDVVDQAESGPEAVRLALAHHPDVVLLDVHMPGGSGLEAVGLIKQQMNVPVIMLTVSDQDKDLLGALSAGADGYLLKNSEPEQLHEAIRQVAAGHGALSPEITAKVMRAAAREKRQPEISLSDREGEIVALLASGATTAEIAAALTISTNTVKTHIQRMLRKLGASNRAEAVAKAAGLGLLPKE